MFSLLPKHISNSNIHWAYIFSQPIRNQLLFHDGSMKPSILQKMSILCGFQSHHLLSKNLHILQNPLNRVKKWKSATKTEKKITTAIISRPWSSWPYGYNGALTVMCRNWTLATIGIDNICRCINQSNIRLRPWRS